MSEQFTDGIAQGMERSLRKGAESAASTAAHNQLAAEGRASVAQTVALAAQSDAKVLAEINAQQKEKIQQLSESEIAHSTVLSALREMLKEVEQRLDPAERLRVRERLVQVARTVIADSQQKNPHLNVVRGIKNNLPRTNEEYGLV